jgi:serine/threonine protein kinase
MEYMDAGTLDGIFRANGPFSETSLAHIAYQVLNGLKYLHEHNIVHLDIKPSNLLVSKDMKVKIADFGVSKIVHGIVSRAATNYHNMCEGTHAYMSPERLDSHTFGSGCVYAGDVWSLGVTLLELHVGHFPFFPAGKKPTNWMELVLVICFGESPSFPKEASEEFRSFIKCCLEKEPSKRWTVSQLLSHPYVCLGEKLGK